MSGGVSGNALEWALALLRAPGERYALRSRPLPPGIETLLAVAAEASPEALADNARKLGEPEGRVREAARFYAREVLFHPDADAYRTLGVASGASAEQIKTHHRLLQHWLHPDRQRSEDDSVFAARVNTAWNELRNQKRRSAYDESLREEQVAQFAHPHQELAAGSPARRSPGWVQHDVQLQPTNGWRHRLPVLTLIGVCALLGWLAIREGEREPEAWDWKEGGRQTAQADELQAGAPTEAPIPAAERSPQAARIAAREASARDATAKAIAAKEATAKAIAAREAAAKALAARQAAAKAIAVREAAAKTLATRQAAAKAIAVREATAKAVAAREAAAKALAARQAAAKAIAVREVTAKAVAAREAAAKALAARQAAAKVIAVREATAKALAAREAATKAIAAREAAAKALAAREAATKAIAARQATAKAIAVREAAAKATAARESAAKAVAVRQAAAKTIAAREVAAKAIAAREATAKASAATEATAKAVALRQATAKAAAAKETVAKAAAAKEAVAKAAAAKEAVAKAAAAKDAVAKAAAVARAPSEAQSAGASPRAASASPPAPDFVRITQARQVGSQVLEYFRKIRQPPPPVWNSPAIMSSADGMRSQLHDQGQTRLDQPQWRINATSATMTSAFRAGDTAATMRGVLAVNMVWRENHWLVTGVSMERAR